jgi:hypothetical protein
MFTSTLTSEWHSVLHKLIHVRPMRYRTMSLLTRVPLHYKSAIELRPISKMKRARATSVPRLLSLVALVSLVLSLVLLVKFSRSGRRIWF